MIQRMLATCLITASLLAPTQSEASILPHSPQVTSGEIGEWALAAVPPGPDGRVYAQVSASPELGIAVVFGGLTEHGVDNDTYWMDTGQSENRWDTLDPQSPAPSPRTNAAVAWDSDAHRMLLFGGIEDVNIVDSTVLFGQNFLNDVWALQFDESGEGPPHWEQLFAGSQNPLDAPSRRAAPAAVYDPIGKRLIVHGGNDTLRGQLGSLGELGESLTGARTLHQGLNDVWSFDLATGLWTKLSGGTPRDEPALFQHQAVYDPVSRQVVVTGGTLGRDPYSGDLRYSDRTWSFDLGTNRWTQWLPQGDSPAMAGGAYGYSESLGALVVTRGVVHWQSEIDETPVYALKLGPAGEGAEWTTLPSKGTAFPLLPWKGMGTSGAVAGDTLLVMGGTHLYSSSEGWDHDARLSAFDITSTRWRTLFSDADSMGPTAGTTAVYDSTRRHMLVVGGRGRVGAVWDLDLATGTWSRVVAPGAAPQPDTWDLNLAAAYDTARHRLLVVSGDRVHALSLEGNPMWSVLPTLGDAPALKEASAFYDPVRDRLVLVSGRFTTPYYDYYFGGLQQPDLNDKVFALHLSGTPAWRELPTGGSAPERTGADVAYDASRDRLLLFGGRDPATSNLTADVFELSLTGNGTWRPVSTAGVGPSARAGATVVYDSANERMLVYGGVRSDPATYELSSAGAPTWSKVSTTGDPLGREEPAGIYDAAGSRLVVYGGHTEGNNTDLAGSRDAYALTLGGTAPGPSSAAPQTYAPPGRNPVRGGTWSTLGPPGARTIPVALSPQFDLDRTIYAGTVNTQKTQNAAAGLYVSRDAGATWQPSGGDIRGAAVLRIAPSPADANVAYAATRGAESGVGVYVSHDRGATWMGASTGLPPGAYYALATNPGDSTVAWAGSNRGGLYRTLDSGESWEPFGFEDEWVYGLTAIPRPDGARLLAATRNLSSDMHGSGRVFLSDDLGETWDLVYSNEDFVTYGFAYDPSDPSRVLLSSGNGVWRSEDGGRAWELLEYKAIQAAGLAFDPTSNGEVVYAAGVAYAINFGGFAGGELSPAQTPGFFRSTDGGKTWTKLAGTPQEEDFGSVAVDSGGKFVIASSLESGPYVSENGGAFLRRATGFKQFVTTSVAIDAANPNHLVAATEYDGVRVSDDAGQTWKQFKAPDGQPFWYAAASPIDSGRVLGGNYSSLYKSENGGRTWTTMGLEGYPGFYHRQPGGIAFHPTDENTWYVSMSDGRVAATHDNGQSFTYGSVGGYGICAIPLALSPAAPNTLLVGDVCGRGVLRSDDGGDTWQSSSVGLDDGNVSALAFHPTDPNLVWAGTLHRGVYRSDDGGRTWRSARAGLGYRYVRFLTVDPQGRLYAAVQNGGVFESDDGGTSWTKITEGLTGRDVLHVLAGKQGGVFAATNGAGVSALSPTA
jgi:photosystem II stability/assembly factor-like uncharacterized protein